MSNGDLVAKLWRWGHEIAAGKTSVHPEDRLREQRHGGYWLVER